MWWILLVYPLMFAAFFYAGYRCRMGSRNRLKSLVAAMGLGALLGLAAGVMHDLALSYDYFVSQLRAHPIGPTQILFGVTGAALSWAGWKARGDVERRQAK